MASESEIQGSILDYLVKAIPEHKGFFYRTEPGGGYGRRSHKKDRGQPDITGCYFGHWCGFEVKTKTGALRESQELFRGRIEAIKGDGFYFVVRSLDDVISALKVVEGRLNQQAKEA